MNEATVRVIGIERKKLIGSDLIGSKYVDIYVIPSRHNLTLCSSSLLNKNGDSGLTEGEGLEIICESLVLTKGDGLEIICESLVLMC